MVEEFGLRAKIEPEVDDESVQRESGRLEREMEDIDPEITPSVSGLASKIKSAAGSALGGLGTAAGVGASVATSSIPNSQNFLPDGPSLDAGGLVDIGVGGGANEERIAELIELTREQNEILAEQTEAIDDDFLSGSQNGAQGAVTDAAESGGAGLLGRLGAKLGAFGAGAVGLGSIPGIALGGTGLFGAFGLADRATNGGSEGFQLRNFARGAEVNNTALEQTDDPSEGIDPGQSFGSFASERFDETLFQPLEDAANKISNADLGESLDKILEDAEDQFGSISLDVNEERLPSLPAPSESDLPALEIPQIPKLRTPSEDDLPGLPVPEANALPTLPTPAKSDLPDLPVPSRSDLPELPGPDAQDLPTLPAPSADELPALPVPDINDLPTIPIPEELKTFLGIESSSGQEDTESSDEEIPGGPAMVGGEPPGDQSQTTQESRPVEVILENTFNIDPDKLADRVREEAEEASRDAAEKLLREMERGSTGVGSIARR